MTNPVLTNATGAAVFGTVCTITAIFARMTRVCPGAGCKHGTCAEAGSEKNHGKHQECVDALVKSVHIHLGEPVDTKSLRIVPQACSLMGHRVFLKPGHQKHH